VKRLYGETCLIQFEDFANANAFRLLEKYKKRACTFNDDIQGTASVALSGLITAVKMTGIEMKDCRFLFYGAGEAAIGTANLIVLALMQKGLSEQEARANIWLVDSKGLIVKDRPAGGINHEKAPFAKPAEPLKTLAESIDFVKPTALIGCAAQGKQFTKELIEKMSTMNKNPIIFALSNPTSKAECTAEEAYTHSNGNCVFASGSPFSKVDFNGKTFYPGQGNNCYIFPAVGLACIACNIKHIPEEFFIVAAESLSSQVNEQEMSEGRTYPNLNRIQAVSLKIAIDVATYAFEHDLCHVYPKPESIEDFIQSQVYKYDYSDSIRTNWSWPKL
jgi:malate dehydrogenase (oxaloacetate-decarboxylating)(NADP+)